MCTAIHRCKYVSKQIIRPVYAGVFVVFAFTILYLE